MFSKYVNKNLCIYKPVCKIIQNEQILSFFYKKKFKKVIDMSFYENCNNQSLTISAVIFDDICRVFQKVRLICLTASILESPIDLCFLFV